MHRPLLPMLLALALLGAKSEPAKSDPTGSPSTASSTGASSAPNAAPTAAASPAAATGTGAAAPTAPLTKAQVKSLVAYRSVLMQEMGKNLKLANLVSGGQVNRPGDLPAFAAALAAAPLGELFPAGTGPEAVDTGAKSELWTDPDGFARAVGAYQEKARAFSTAAASGDAAAVKTSLQDLGDTCSGCHDKYRMED